MNKSLVSISVLLMMAGCGAQSGRTIVTQSASSEPLLIRAPESGTYKLYTTYSPNPTTTVNLREGDQLGFRRSADGQSMEGVADGQSQVLPRGSTGAMWKLEK